MKKIIQDKIRYYTSQEGKFVDRYLESTRRQDRDTLIRVREKIKIYKEVLQLIEE